MLLIFLKIVKYFKKLVKIKEITQQFDDIKLKINFIP